MQRLLLLGIAVLLYQFRGGQSHEPTSPTSISVSSDTTVTEIQLEIAPEDQMLHNVRLTFDFIADRIGREMYWDSQENLVIKAENSTDPDTVYLSAIWTKPRMILSYNETSTETKIVGYETGNHYIDTHAKTAMRLQMEGGVPASITLAQGIHESAWGGSKLAKVHNHFGIKCQGRGHHQIKEGKRIGTILGHCVNLHDDHKNDMFFTYVDADQSYAAHDHLLHRIKRSDDGEELRTTGSYGYILKEIPNNDKVTRKFVAIKGAMNLIDGKTYTFSYWEWWAIELKNFGYATDPKYAEKIIRTIKNYNLTRYDKISNQTNSVFADAEFGSSDGPT